MPLLFVGEPPIGSKTKMMESSENRWTMKQNALGAADADRLEAFLLKTVDAGLAGAIFIVPWIMGGRDAIGHLILAALAAATALAWFVRQAIRGGNILRPAWPLALVFLGAAFLLFQTIPLPRELLQWLSPRQADLLPLWYGAADASLGRWACISLAPAETRAALVLFLAYSMLFLVTIQRVKGIDDIERILKWCALSAVALAAFALVQLVAGNGKFFWFFEHPYTDTLHRAKGSFTNCNHFAHFLALGLGPLVWWLYGSIEQNINKSSGKSPLAKNSGIFRDSQCPLLGLALAAIVFAGVLSLSRGGMAAIFLAIVVAGAFCYKSSGNFLRIFGVMAAAGFLIVAALSIFGLDQVVPRVESAIDVTSSKTDWSSNRFTLWKAAFKAVPDFLWTGAGAGTFSDIYPIYEGGSLPESVEFTHAENSYLHNLLENGVFSCSMLVAGLGACLFWCAAGWKCGGKLKACAGAIAAGLCVCAAHGAVDFVWYVPACAAMTTILAGCAWRVWRLSKKPPRTTANPPRWIAYAAAAVLVMIGTWMVCNRFGPAMAEPYWNRYLVGCEAAKSSRQTAELPASSVSVRPIMTDAMLLSCLENTVSWDPNHARAQLALAEMHLKLFEAKQKTAKNRMSLTSIRDAALDANFQSREELSRWLDRAIGDSAENLKFALLHCRRSLELRPLQGHGYVYLAVLGFLDYGRGPSKRDCIRQAMILRPFDGAVALAAASEALLDGDEARWLELAKRSFDRGRKYQQQIVGELVGRASPENVPEIIAFIEETFQPDSRGLDILYEACAKQCPREQLVDLNLARAIASEKDAAQTNGPSAAYLWLRAQYIYVDLGDGLRAFRCAQNALNADPNNYNAHYQFALRLLERNMYSETESELEWCRQRKPNDKLVEIRMKEVIKARLNAERSNPGSAVRK